MLSSLIQHRFNRSTKTFYFLQILWTFSIYLESVAILPQLFMISKTGEAESITSHYLFALGAYRALYIVNWIYRYYYEGFYDFIAIIAGCVQTALYCDFFYLYITKGNVNLYLFIFNICIIMIIVVGRGLGTTPWVGVRPQPRGGKKSHLEGYCTNEYNPGMMSYISQMLEPVCLPH